MGHRRFGVVLGLVLVGLLAGCASGEPSADSPGSENMSPADAREFIAQVQKDRGTAGPGAPVTNMDELLDVLASDAISRFASAAELVGGQPGIDAMSLHALIELSWSDGFSTVASIVEEQRKRANATQSRLSQERDAGRTLSESQAKQLEQAKKDVAFDVKARGALDVLARDHLQVAGGIVTDVVRQFPDDMRTYRVAAFYYLLAGDWQHFDVAMTWLKALENKEAGLKYLRGMEAMERYVMQNDATKFFHEALALNPKMVRAQVKLVLTEDGIEGVHRELENLRAMAPQHPVVLIAGPSITQEYDLTKAFDQAREARHPAAPPASAVPSDAVAPNDAPPASAPSPAQ